MFSMEPEPANRSAEIGGSDLFLVGLGLGQRPMFEFDLLFDAVTDD